MFFLSQSITNSLKAFEEPKSIFSQCSVCSVSEAVPPPSSTPQRDWPLLSASRLIIPSIDFDGVCSGLSCQSAVAVAFKAKLVFTVSADEFMEIIENIPIIIVSASKIDNVFFVILLYIHLLLSVFKY